MSARPMLLAATMSVAGIAGAADDDSVLRIGLIGQLPPGMHRDLSTLAASVYAGGFVQRGMTHFDAQGRTACSLCETLPTSANGGVRKDSTPQGAAGQVVTYRLRPGLKWDDATPLVAEDFVFAWSIGRRSDSGYAWRTRLADEIWSVTAPDERTLVVRRRGVSCDPADFRIAPLPRHVEREPLTGAYAAQSAYVRSPTQRGLYNGPYRVASFSADRIVLERNEAWSGASPAQDRLELVSRPTPEAMTEALVKGEVDLVPALSSSTLAVAEAAARRAPGEVADLRRSGRNLVQVTLNLSQRPFDDLRVRQALLLVLDRGALAKAFGTGADRAVSFLTERFPYHVPALPPDTTDGASRARSLLAGAGWKAGADGVLRNGRGETFAFRLAVQRSLADRPFVSDIVSAWRALGIVATVEPFGGLGTLARSDGPQAALFGWTLEGGSNVDYAIFDSRAVPAAGEERAGANVFRYSNADVDRIVDRLRGSCAVHELGPLYGELQRRIAADLPLLPLFFTPEVSVLRRDLLPHDAAAAALFTLSDEVEDWPIR